MHNLGTVIRFEITRTLKKKSFWIMALLFPLMMAGIFAIVFFSNKTTDEALKNTEKQQFSIVVKDDSHQLNAQIIDGFHARTIDSKADGIAQVQSGTTDAFYYYPSDLQHQPVEVYGKDAGLFDNGRYEAVAKALLTAAASTTVSPNVRVILQGGVAFKTNTYKDGALYDGFKQLIAPGMFLVLFYILITMFGNQMLNSTTEEKENRVIEMILTTIEARTLIIGKIISLIALGFLQIVIIMTPLIIGYLLLRDKLALPSLDLSSIPLDPTRLLIGLVIFAASFMLFTGLLVTAGAMAPTAKEAGSFFGIVMMMVFGPLYAVSLFVSAPGSGLVQFLSFFPFTAPIPLLLRNAVGNLTVPEALIACAILIVTAAVVIKVAVGVFQHGALEYNRRLGLREILKR